MQAKKLLILFLFFFPFLSIYAHSEPHFLSAPLSPDLQNQLIEKKIWRSGCPVPLDDLRALLVSYYDFQGKPQVGQIIMHRSVANSALRLFRELYNMRFPFSTIDTLVQFQGDIEKAESKNVTYGFVCHTSHNFNLEAYGQTLTINPVLNPEISLIDKPRSISFKEREHEPLSATEISNETGTQYAKLQPREGLMSINRDLHLKGFTEIAEAELNKQNFKRAILSNNKISWSKFSFTSNPKQEKLEDQTYFINPLNQTKGNTIFKFEILPTVIKDQLIKNNYWQKGCPISLDKLNLVTFSYYDFDGTSKIGQLVIYDAIAPFVMQAFKELYLQKFPIETPTIIANSQIYLTSAFKCRPITGGSGFSLHSYGLAIDINASRNPYIGAFNQKGQDLIGLLLPYTTLSLNYLNRNQIHPGMNEGVTRIMRKNGFLEWGGDWQDRADFMHFQVPKNIALNLISLDITSARKLIQLMIENPLAAQKMSNDRRWQYLYQLFPEHYMESLQKYFPLLRNQKESAVLNRIYLDLLNSNH